MKIKLLFPLLLFSMILDAQNVIIPDANFKAYLVGNTDINLNGDSEIQLSEANNFEGAIDCSNKFISDLTGIETFIKITTLNCNDNQLTNLNVFNNVSLISLFCDSNLLTNLDLSNNLSLNYLLCGYNKLTNLNLGDGVNLLYIDCYSNQLPSLDVSKNTALFNLQCGANKLTTLDVTKNIALTELSFPFNQISSLDVSKNLVLKNLFCYLNQITSLDLTKNTVLKFLSSYSNQLTSLDLSQNTALTDLVIAHNQIKTLDISENLILNYLDCRENELTSLNLKNGNNQAITTMESFNNRNLTCIQVDNVANANSYVATNNWKKDATSNFNIECFLASSESDKEKITLFPNPTKDFVNLSAKSNLTIYNTLGQKLASEKDVFSLDLSKFENGVYIFVISDKNGIEIQRSKVIKK